MSVPKRYIGLYHRYRMHDLTDIMETIIIAQGYIQINVVVSSQRRYDYDRRGAAQAISL